MKLAQSRLTSQGQVSVPAAVRQHLGLAPGSVLEWSADGERVVVRRAHRHSNADLHAALFSDGAPPTRSLAELKAAVALDVTTRHRPRARR